MKPPGLSLGARTGSCGSLPSPSAGGGTAASPLPCAPPAVRRPLKTLHPAARIRRLCLNRELGMLSLLLVSILVLLAQLFPLYKDLIQNNKRFRDISPSFETHQSHVIDNVQLVNPKQQSANYENKILRFPPIVPQTTIPLQHPCDNLSYAPPPADKKLTGSRPCPVCYVPVKQAMAFMPSSPSVSPSLKNLTYITNEEIIVPSLDVSSNEHGSVFGGYPSLKQRNDSFVIKDSMNVHCGFAKGNKPGRGTGFDIDDSDLLEMEQCHGVVVASAIFGNYDVVQQPNGISEDAKTNVCFFMFVDEQTEAYIKNSSGIDNIRRVGLWRMVVVHNLPYTDARRNGKVPKLLLHRLFPNARYSLWIDGKLELVVDPYKILERFLWREKATFAISKHYTRFDVFVEAEANKAAGKYDNASIDYQIEFYKREGLTHYSEAKLPITSDVPEGCVIIREHTPITNLFTCLWFNEVERFTARDQLSFSTVRDKIMSKVNWGLNMFEDCERRNFVVQAYHRDLLEKRSSSSSQSHPPPMVNNKLLRKLLPDKVSDNFVGSSARKPPPVKHGKDKKSSSRRRRHRAGTASITGST